MYTFKRATKTLTNSRLDTTLKASKNLFHQTLHLLDDTKPYQLPFASTTLSSLTLIALPLSEGLDDCGGRCLDSWLVALWYSTAAMERSIWRINRSGSGGCATCLFVLVSSFLVLKPSLDICLLLCCASTCKTRKQHPTRSRSRGLFQPLQQYISYPIDSSTTVRSQNNTSIEALRHTPTQNRRVLAS